MTKTKKNNNNKSKAALAAAAIKSWYVNDDGHNDTDPRVVVDHDRNHGDAEDTMVASTASPLMLLTGLDVAAIGKFLTQPINATELQFNRSLKAYIEEQGGPDAILNRSVEGGGEYYNNRRSNNHHHHKKNEKKKKQKKNKKGKKHNDLMGTEAPTSFSDAIITAEEMYRGRSATTDTMGTEDTNRHPVILNEGGPHSIFHRSLEQNKRTIP